MYINWNDRKSQERRYEQQRKNAQANYELKLFLAKKQLEALEREIEGLKRDR